MNTRNQKQNRIWKVEMNTRNLVQYGTRLVLAALILAVVFQAFGIAPKDNPVHAQTNDVWEFVSQTVADGTCFAPNTAISVTWTVKNAGSKNWSGYSFNTVSVPLTNVGSTVNLAASFTTPSTEGAYRAQYSLKDETSNTVLSVNGSASMWLDYIVGNCDNTSSPAIASQNGVNNQATTPGGHWVEVAEQSHMVCKWQTIFGCWWSEKVIDVPASRTWVPDPVATTPPPAIIQSSAPAETQPPVATAQVAPSGSCINQGETQIGNGWTVVCLGNVWMNAKLDSSGNTVVPVPVQTAPAPTTPIPTGTPSSFNGVALPSTSSNVISGGGVFMYMFAGTMTLPANYVLVAEGAAYTTLSAAGTSVVSTIAACSMPLVVIGIAVFTAYGISALVAIPATIVHPPAVPAPVAPPYLTLEETATGLIGIPGIIQMENSVMTIEVLQNNAEGCHINVGLESDYTPNKDPLQSNIRETVKHSGPCNKSDIRYLVESLIRQVREFIEHAKKILNDPLSYGATAKDIAAMKVIVEQFPKIVHELLILLLSL